MRTSRDFTFKLVACAIYKHQLPLEGVAGERVNSKRVAPHHLPHYASHALVASASERRLLFSVFINKLRGGQAGAKGCATNAYINKSIIAPSTLTQLTVILNQLCMWQAYVTYAQYVYLVF